MKKIAKNEMKKVKGGIDPCVLECRLERNRCLWSGANVGICTDYYSVCVESCGFV